MTTLRPLTEGLQKVAKEELNEVESRIPEDIEALRTWIGKQPHLKARTDAQFLIAFLRSSKYSLEKAKSKLDSFYTIKTLMPELFSNKRVDQKLLDLCRSGCYISLPKTLSESGPRIQVTNYAKFDTKKYTFKDLFYYQLMLLDIQIYEDDNSVISGYIEIIDLAKITISFLAQIEPILIKKLSIFADKAAPLRLKGFHILNCPKEAQALLSLCRSLMSEKIQKRFYVHKNLEELYKIIPKDYLPIEYGGTNGTIAEIQAETEQKFLEFSNYFIEDDDYGVNEKLRPGKKIDYDSFFGIDGSFRQLNID